jgi:hypothetical protein
MDWGIPLQSGPGGISARTRLMTRLAALAVWLALGFALLSTQPQTLPSLEPTGVAAVRLEPLAQLPLLVPPPTIVPPKQPDPALKQTSPTTSKSTASKALPNRPPSKSLAPARFGPSPTGLGGSTTPAAPVGIASGPSQPSSGVGVPTLNAQSQAIIKAQACAQIDIKDRPPDCPPNAELKRLLQLARGPKYRPENAEAFTRNQLRWRDIPPPCLEDGQKVKMTGMGACVRFGTPPSRVRSPQEICEAKGLGGCAPVPSQAAVSAAVKQAKGQ